MVFLERVATISVVTSSAAGTPAPVSASHSSTHWAAIFTVAFAMITAAAAIYAARQVHIAKRSLLAQTSRDLWAGWQGLSEARQKAARFDSPEEFAEAYERFWSERSAEYYALSRIPDFFEELGVLVDLGGIDVEFLRRIFGGIIVLYWDDWRLAVKRIRDLEDQHDYNRPDEDRAYRAWEVLARELALRLKMPFTPLEDGPDAVQGAGTSS